MIAVVVVALLAAEPDEGYTRRWSGSLSGFALLPTTGTKDLAFSGSVEMAFQPLPFIRLFHVVAPGESLRSSSFRGEGPRMLFGVDGIASPLAPLDLSLGLSAGYVLGYVCGGDVCAGGPKFSMQLRLFVGYGILPWLALGMLASWNTLFVSTPITSWFELGPRIAFRW